MSNKKVKIVGYAQRVFYNNNIEYRNFTPDLVGFQLASNSGTPLFTMGNFYITTNMEPKTDKVFNTTKFSNFITLSTLNLDVESLNIIVDKATKPELNLNKTNLNYYALFGSLTEFVRVSLENIITTWPASLYMDPVSQDDIGNPLNGYTFENYIYDTLNQVSTFKINTSFIDNKFQINYLKNGTILNTFNETNDLRNLTVNYASYSVLYNDTEYEVLEFTGSTYTTSDYIYFKVKGNPFSGLGTTSKIKYHIKPNKLKVDTFFNTLPDFESYLLNRQITPLYTSEFKYPIKSDTGVILYITDTLTWPVSDGYNIDFNTQEYVSYATKLVDISSANDSNQSDLMNRFLVSESISSFDTAPVYLSDQDQDTSGGKVNKTLHIYGRSFDDVNKFITGIKFANTVSYDKQDNTPDIYLKNLARVLGWELLGSVLENELLSKYVTNNPSTYSGMSVGYTPYEADIELWRRIILNTPWIWKSKGARKSIEFLLKFIGAPEGLIKFNEYIYKADAPIDINLFTNALILNNLPVDLSQYPIDADGFPSPLPNTDSMYYQNYGLWYRQTGGQSSTVDILSGNNPHLGPYDGGFKYINQFKQLIPNFSSVTISSQTITTDSTNLFSNYNLGSINNYSGNTYVDAVTENGISLDDCYVVTTDIIPDPKPTTFINDCGCSDCSTDNTLSICVKNKTNTNTNTSECPPSLHSTTPSTTDGIIYFNYYQYYQDGSIVGGTSTPTLYNTVYGSKECCSVNNGQPFLYNEYDNQNNLKNSGYVCCTVSATKPNCGCFVACKWLASTTPVNIYGEFYLGFIQPDGTPALVMPDACNCVTKIDNSPVYMTAVQNITDTNTNQIGTACKLTIDGRADLANGENSKIVQYYKDKASKCV